MRGQRHAPAAPYPRERPGTHFTGGWVGLRAGLDRCGKSRPPPGLDPRTTQPVGSRYTDYATRPTDPRPNIPINTAFLPIMEIAFRWFADYKGTLPYSIEHMFISVSFTDT
jgi:hypothetical protein